MAPKGKRNSGTLLRCIIISKLELVREIQNAQKGIPIRNQELDAYKKKIEKYEKFFSSSEQDIILQSKELNQ